MRLTTSGSSGGVQTFWVVGRKSATELIVASTWRDSLWVLWFQFVAWLFRVRERMRSQHREPEYRTDDVSGPVMVAPADESSEHDVDPKSLN